MELINANAGLFVKMVIAEWDKQNNNFDKFLSNLKEEQLSKEIAPGKNTGMYLVAHLIAVSDAMLPLLGFGEKLFPHLQVPFIDTPDKSGQQGLSLDELKNHLKIVNENLNKHIGSTTPEEWFKRHSAVSEGDFIKEPHRNKLNIMINRSNHMSYHLGQLVLLR
jgi:hypothetical protein